MEVMPLGAFGRGGLDGKIAVRQLNAANGVRNLWEGYSRAKSGFIFWGA